MKWYVDAIAIHTKGKFTDLFLEDRNEIQSSGMYGEKHE